MKHPLEVVDPYLSSCIANMQDKLPKIPTSVSLFDHMKEDKRGPGRNPEWNYHTHVMKEHSDWAEAQVHWLKNKAWVDTTAPCPWTLGFRKSPDSEIVGLSNVPGWVRAVLLLRQRGTSSNYENTLLRLVDKVTQLHWSQGRVMMEAYDELRHEPYEAINERLVMNVKAMQAQKEDDQHHLEYPDEEIEE